LRLKFIKSEIIGQITQENNDVFLLHVGKKALLPSYFLTVRNFMISYVREKTEIIVNVDTDAQVIKMLMQYPVKLVLT